MLRGSIRLRNDYIGNPFLSPSSVCLRSLHYTRRLALETIRSSVKRESPSPSSFPSPFPFPFTPSRFCPPISDFQVSAKRINLFIRDFPPLPPPSSPTRIVNARQKFIFAKSRLKIYILFFFSSPSFPLLPLPPSF